MQHNATRELDARSTVRYAIGGPCGHTAGLRHCQRVATHRRACDLGPMLSKPPQLDSFARLKWLPTPLVVQDLHAGLAAGLKGR